MRYWHDAIAPHVDGTHVRLLYASMVAEVLEQVASAETNSGSTLPSTPGRQL
jgi:hypothetical protein